MDGGREGPDWVHERIVVVIVRDRDVLFRVFLLLKGPGDSFCVKEVGVLVGELTIAHEETDVFELA